MALKKGRTTSEFVVSVGAAILGAGLAFGIVTMDHVDAVVKSAGAISGSLIAACGALGYNISRGLAKKGS
jgi:uncharacterized protein (DUF697 family)